MTIDNCTNNQLVEDFWGQSASTVLFVNSLLVNVGTAGAATVTTNHTAWITDSGGQVFQGFGANGYYLSSGSLIVDDIDAGTTTADRQGLYWFTTQASQAIEGITITMVDLGYKRVGS